MHQAFPQRYFLQIAYKGTRYHGWQTQQNASSIQQTLEEALSCLLQQPTCIVGSSRTDTGVHARQQFAHLDLPPTVSLPKLLYQLNALLPLDIRAQAIYSVPHSAHARFDAVERTYEYYIGQLPNPFEQDTRYYINRALSIVPLNQAAAYLVGQQDFKSFTKVHTDVKHYRCHVREAGWYTTAEGIVFRISANRFLRGMVRAIVGSLIPVGLGQQPPEVIQTILAQGHRAAAGPAAPARGLFLTKVSYPENYFASN